MAWNLFGFSICSSWWVLGGSSLLVSGWEAFKSRLTRSLRDNDHVTMFIDHVSKSWDHHGNQLQEVWPKWTKKSSEKGTIHQNRPVLKEIPFQQTYSCEKYPWCMPSYGGLHFLSAWCSTLLRPFAHHFSVGKHSSKRKLMKAHHDMHGPAIAISVVPKCNYYTALLRCA